MDRRWWLMLIDYFVVVIQECPGNHVDCSNGNHHCIQTYEQMRTKGLIILASRSSSRSLVSLNELINYRDHLISHCRRRRPLLRPLLGCVFLVRQLWILSAIFLSSIEAERPPELLWKLSISQKKLSSSFFDDKDGTKQERIELNARNDCVACKYNIGCCIEAAAAAAAAASRDAINDRVEFAHLLFLCCRVCVSSLFFGCCSWIILDIILISLHF